MEHVPVVGMAEGLGEPGSPPGDGLFIGSLGQCRPPGRRAGGHTVVRLEPIERLDQGAARSFLLAQAVLQDLGQCGPAEVGHAEQVEPGRPVDPMGMHRDDVGMLEPGQGLRLAGAAPADFQRDGPIRQLPFPGEEDPRERAATQLLDQVEPGDRLARLGESPGGPFRGLLRRRRALPWRSSRSRRADGCPARGAAGRRPGRIARGSRRPQGARRPLRGGSILRR